MHSCAACLDPSRRRRRRRCHCCSIHVKEVRPSPAPAGSECACICSRCDRRIHRFDVKHPIHHPVLSMPPDALPAFSAFSVAHACRGSEAITTAIVTMHKVMVMVMTIAVTSSITKIG